MGNDGTWSPSREWVNRYLTLLGVEHPAPGLEPLGRLIRAHICAVPFENVTAILRRHAHPQGNVPPPDPDALLESWERGLGGGACFELAEMFTRLLLALGYRAHQVLAQITFPGSHQAVIVEFEGRGYLAEVSNGSPFFEPIPLDGTFEICHIGLEFRFRPDATTERWVQERHIDGAWETFCTYDLRPAGPRERDAIYQRHHTPGESWVMDQFRFIRCREDEVYSLFAGRLAHFTAAGKRTVAVADAECAPYLAGAFGMPRLPMEAALRAIRERDRPPARP